MKTKKPFYRTWWFIVLIAFVILGIIGSLINLTETDTNEGKKNAETETETKETNQEDATYKIIDQKHNDSGQTFLSIEVNTEDIGVTEKLIEGIVEDPYKTTGYDPERAKIESLFIQVYKAGSDGVWMNAKVAVTQKGLAQTGLEETKIIELEENN